MPAIINHKEVPLIGLGTWSMGGNHEKDTTHDATNVTAIRYALQKGMFINGAEVYGAGHTDELIGKAAVGFNQAILTSKLTRETLMVSKTIRAAATMITQRFCRPSVDLLYAPHWPFPDTNPHEYLPTVFDLVDEGTVGDIGVSNFDLEQLQEAVAIAEKRGHRIAAIENKFGVLYRGGQTHPKVGLPQPSFDPEMQNYCNTNNILMVAYTPLEKSKVKDHPVIQEVAEEHGVSPFRLSLKWIIDQGITPIVKSSQPRHIDDILGATDVEISHHGKLLLDEIRV